MEKNRDKQPQKRDRVSVKTISDLLRELEGDEDSISPEDAEVYRSTRPDPLGDVERIRAALAGAARRREKLSPKTERDVARDRLLSLLVLLAWEIGPTTNLCDMVMVNRILDQNESDKFLNLLGICDTLIEKLESNEERGTALLVLNDESKLEQAKLAPVFEGQLDRNAMAQALAAVMKEQGLSVRKAAGEADVSASIISQIKSEDASIDQAAKVLDALGFEIDLTVRPKGHS